MNRKIITTLCSMVGVALVGGFLFIMTGMPPKDLLAAKGVGKPEKPLEKAFPSSQKCKRCHLRVFEEWESSAQSRSIETAAFRVTLERFLALSGEKNNTMCFRCHAPHILEYPDHASMFIKEVRSRDPEIDGVGCSQCHLIEKINQKTRPPHPTFTLGKKVYGGYKKPVDNLAHQSVALKLYRSSQYCVTCHDVLPGVSKKGNIPDLLGPWQTTKAEKSGKTCQSCHMPEQFGESANGERNRKVANHSFPGRFGKVRAEAVTLSVKTKVKRDTSQVEVTIQSLIPHNLPLPHPGWSRVVLDLTILGKNLKKSYVEQRYYERVFLDANEKETIYDFEAVKVLKDTVLKPEEKRMEIFTFPTPKNAPSMDVVVSMHYGEIHGPEDFIEAVEEQSTLGRKGLAFQQVQIIEHKENFSLSK